MLVYADKNRRDQNDLLVRSQSHHGGQGGGWKIRKSGEQVVIGGNDMYVSLCRKHYNADAWVNTRS